MHRASLQPPPHPELATPRLRLRPLAQADAPAVFAYVRDPAVLRYTTGRTPTRLEDTEAFLRDALAVPDTRWWGICLARADTVVGMVEFSLLTADRGAIHYSLAPELWGRGLMTEAVIAICCWAFESVSELRTIETAVVVENIASARVLEKVGFLPTLQIEEQWENAPDPVLLDWYTLSRDRWSASRSR